MAALNFFLTGDGSSKCTESDSSEDESDGETKRAFATRLKEHKADIRNNRAQNSALAQHALTLKHNMDWDNFKILAYENDWHKRKFIESFFINSKTNTVNAKNSVQFPAIYQTMLQDQE